MVKIIGYFVLVLVVLFGVTSLIQGLISGLLNKVTKNFRFAANFGGLIGGIITWVFFAYLWSKFTGENLPILLLFICIVGLFIHGNMKHDELTTLSRQHLVSEIWTIILLSGYLMITSSEIVWL